MKFKKALPLLFFLGCRTPLVLDPSVSAIEAGEYALVSSLCEAMPGRGADICRVKEGSPIASSWKIILPSGKRILGGELSVSFKDVTQSYPIGTSPVVEVPLSDLFGEGNWSREDDGIALALATIRYQGSETVEVVRARGIAFFVVTDARLDPLPIDSGFAGFQTLCRVQYSSAGRSAIQCSKSSVGSLN